MRMEITRRYTNLRRDPLFKFHFERFDAFDENTKSDVYLFQPDAGIRSDSKRLAKMSETIRATFRDRDAAKFVKPRDFYPITENDPCFYFVEEKNDHNL